MSIIILIDRDKLLRVVVHRDVHGGAHHLQSFHHTRKLLFERF